MGEVYEFTAVAGTFEDDGSLNYKFIGPVRLTLEEAQADLATCGDWPWSDIEVHQYQGPLPLDTGSVDL